MRRIDLLMATCATIALLPTTALAEQQEATDSDSTGITDIVVTAQKRSEGSQRVPISIAAVDDSALAKVGAVTLDSVQRVTPGLTLSTVGSGFVSYTYVRGAGTNVIDIGADPSVAYFVDEVYQAGTAGLQGDLLDVERIEVLKGPQGTLFGRNAAAGAVSIIIKKPEETFNAWANGDIGTYNQFNLSGGITGPLDSDGAVRYRMALGHRQRDGYVNNLGGKDPGNVNSWTGRGSLAFVGENVTAQISADFVRLRNGMTPQFPSTAAISILNAAALAALPTGEDFSHRYWNYIGFENQDAWSVTGRLDWDLDAIKLTSVTGYRYSHFTRSQDHDGTRANSWTFENEESNRTFSQELRLSGDSDLVNWLVGGFYYNNKAKRRDQVLFGPDFSVPAFAAFPGDYGHKLHTESYALFGQLTFNFTDQLSLIAGARYTHDTKTSDQDHDPYGPAARFQVKLTKTWDSFDPAVTLQFKPSENVMAYASYRQGFKSGGFQTLPGTASLASTPFDPEKVKAWEAGIKSSFLDRHVILNLAAFHNDIVNQQILRLPTPTLTLVDNAGGTRSKGIDATLSLLPIAGLRIDASMTYQQARFTKYLNGTVDYAGNHQLRSPDFTATLAAEYTVPLKSGEIVLRGDMFHQSKIFFDGANLSLPGGYQPQYTLYNARVSFRPGEGNFDVSLYVRNLTNKHYWRNIAVQGPTGVGTPGEPLTAGLSLAWKLR